MTKARFSERQPGVKFTGEYPTWVQICCHEQVEETTDPETGEVTGTEYVYDFNEWSENDPDREAIEADPESYLDYAPTPAPTPVPPVPPIPYDVVEQVAQNTANIEYIACMSDIDLDV